MTKSCPPLTQALLLAAVLIALLGNIAAAAELHVQPVLLEMTAPSASGSITLRNNQDSEITVQTRVLRWVQREGKEELVSTSDVVASPPAVTLSPGADYIVRVVRTTKQPIVGEESYRVLVDQLPNLRRQQARAVNLLIRQSIPVFFRAPTLNPARLAWTVRRDGAKLLISAQNTGDERVRIAALRLKDQMGTNVFLGNGLVGYVLGRSSMSWTMNSVPKTFDASRGSIVSAETDKGPLRATALSHIQE